MLFTPWHFLVNNMNWGNCLLHRSRSKNTVISSTATGQMLYSPVATPTLSGSQSLVNNRRFVCEILPYRHSAFPIITYWDGSWVSLCREVLLTYIHVSIMLTWSTPQKKSHYITDIVILTKTIDRGTAVPTEENFVGFTYSLK